VFLLSFHNNPRATIIIQTEKRKRTTELTIKGKKTSVKQPTKRTNCDGRYSVKKKMKLDTEIEPTVFQDILLLPFSERIINIPITYIYIYK